MSQTALISDRIEAIAARYPRTIDLGLSRVAAQAQRAGLAQGWECPVITVAGTNGKGSTVRLLESMYIANGYRVVSYTSPHLLHFNERIAIDGQPVTDALLQQAIDHVQALIADDGTTFFEFTTLLALQVARWVEPDVLILEVGLGGRLDATNIVDADVAVITSIGLDHCEYLGTTREQVGREKAGIIKSGCQAVCADLDPPASIAAYAQQVGVKVLQIDRDFTVQQLGDHCSYHGISDAWYLPMPGLRLQNVAAALTVIQCLSARLPISLMAVADALRHVQLAGRFQRVTAPVPMVLDVAHNADSVQNLADCCRKAGINQVPVVIGMLKTKDVDASLQPLLGLASDWHVVELPDERGMPAQQIQALLAHKGVKSCYTWASVSQALEACAMEGKVSAGSPLIVMGSFVTVGLAMQWIAEVETLEGIR